MDFKEIIYTKEEGIATITLNRPEALNALTDTMLREWVEAIEDAKHDDEVKVLVLTGAGRGFCAGMDVKSAAARPGSLPLGEGKYWLHNSVHRIPLALDDFDKPYIGAINGPAAGAGMDMASMCDLRIASERARFGMTYLRMGLIPGDGGCWLLPRIIGVAKALELIWTGRMIDAQEALSIGYVSKVVLHEELPGATMELARQLAQGPAVAIQLAKRLVYRGLEMDFRRALEAAESAMMVCLGTEDALEGPRAWVEKREPRFKGR